MIFVLMYEYGLSGCAPAFAGMHHWAQQGCASIATSKQVRKTFNMIPDYSEAGNLQWSCARRINPSLGTATGFSCRDRRGGWLVKRGPSKIAKVDAYSFCDVEELLSRLVV
jgi:hypothetical protein